MDNVVSIINLLLAGGGLAALIRAISIARNSNKKADIDALQETLDTVQTTYKKTIKDLESRIEFLEIGYAEQYQETQHYKKRVEELEEKVEVLEDELRKKNILIDKKDLDIMRLEQENIELRKAGGKRTGLETNDITN